MEAEVDAPSLSVMKSIEVDIYRYLWATKADQTDSNRSFGRFQSTDEHDNKHYLVMKGVSVPDTVIFFQGKPIAWYFTSKKSGLVKKKHTKNVNRENLQESFTKKDSIKTAWQSRRSCDIAGCFLTKDAKGLTTNAQFLSRTEIKSFLDSNHASSGVLQKFVTPVNPCNEVIRIEWTPRISLIERRVNSNQLDNVRLAMEDRGVTFEEIPTNKNSLVKMCTDTFVSENGALARALRKACFKIGEHLAIVHPAHTMPTKMVLYFKTGSGNKVWFLYCDKLQMTPLSSSLVPWSKAGMTKTISGLLGSESKPKRTNSKSHMAQSSSESFLLRYESSKKEVQQEKVQSTISQVPQGSVGSWTCRGCGGCFGKATEKYIMLLKNLVLHKALQQNNNQIKALSAKMLVEALSALRPDLKQSFVKRKLASDEFNSEPVKICGDCINEVQESEELRDEDQHPEAETEIQTQSKQAAAPTPASAREERKETLSPVDLATSRSQPDEEVALRRRNPRRWPLSDKHTKHLRKRTKNARSAHQVMEARGLANPKDIVVGTRRDAEYFGLPKKLKHASQIRNPKNPSNIMSSFGMRVHRNEAKLLNNKTWSESKEDEDLPSVMEPTSSLHKLRKNAVLETQNDMMSYLERLVNQNKSKIETRSIFGKSRKQRSPKNKPRWPTIA